MKSRTFDQRPHQRQDIPRVLGHCLAEKPVSARRRPDQPEEHADRRGLAGAVRAEEPIDGPTWPQQVDGVDRNLLMEPFGQPIRGNCEVTQFSVHLAASAAYRPSGVTAPTTSRPSSVSSAENTVPAIRCPEPQMPKTLGSMATCFISWATVLSVVAPAAKGVPVGAGILTTTTLPQPRPITLGMSADFVCGATVLVLEPVAVFAPAGAF